MDQNAHLQFDNLAAEFDIFVLLILALMGCQCKDRSVWFLEITCRLLFQLAKQPVPISTCLIYNLNSFKEHQHSFILSCKARQYFKLFSPSQRGARMKCFLRSFTFILIFAPVSYLLG